MLIARYISQRAALSLRSLSARQLDRDHLMCTSLNNLHKSPTPTANECRPFHSSHTTLASKQNHNKKPQRRTKDNQDRSKSDQKPPPNSKRERKFNKMLKKHAEASPKEIPPAYLTRTASPNVYIATSAIMNAQGGDLLVDPLTLFAEYNTNHSSKNSAGVSSTKQRKNSLIPHIFRQSHLQYFSPAVFPNHEPPTDGTPEVCFLGRSNTGKSSLINALHTLILKSGGGGGGRNKNTTASGGGELARTSKTPGRTQTINYFGLVSNNAKSASNDAPKAKLFLVDMPGFGYASAPDESVDAWQKRTQEFLISRTLVPEERGDTVKPWPSASKTSARDKKAIQHIASAPPLKRLYLLIDSRLKEPQYIDLSVMGWCDEYSIPYTLVLTKVDGSSRAHCVKLTNQLCMRYHSLLMDQAFNEEGEGEIFMDPVVYWTSAKDGLGMEELLSSVEGCLLDRHDDSEMYGLDDIGFAVDENDLDEEEDDDSDWELEDDEIDSDSQNADVT